MEKFNIQKVIEQYNPNIEELSKILFPYIKYPKQAFDRVLKGEANLDTEQISILASYLGVFVSDLFSLDNGWKGGWNKDLGCVSFIKGEYKVNLNYNGSFIMVYKNEKLVYQIVGCDIHNMSLMDFIQYINNLINQFN